MSDKFSENLTKNLSVILFYTCLIVLLVNFSLIKLIGGAEPGEEVDFSENATVKITAKMVQELRQELIREFAAAPPGTYDPLDIDRIKNKTDSWPVRRYVIYRRGNIPAAAEHAKAVLQWRARSRLNHLTVAEDFPCSFIYSGILMVTTDRQSRPLIMFNLAGIRRYPHVRDLLIKYVYWSIDHVDRSSAAKGFGVLIPMSKLGMENVDLSVIAAFYPLSTRFPVGFKYVLYMSPAMGWWVIRLKCCLKWSRPIWRILRRLRLGMRFIGM